MSILIASQILKVHDAHSLTNSNTQMSKFVSMELQYTNYFKLPDHFHKSRQISVIGRW